MSSHEPDPNRFVGIVKIYFHLFLVGGLTFQTILIYLIIRKSPSSLAHLKYFLVNTASCQVLNILMGYFMQHRSLPSSTTFAVLADGLCRKISPYACFAGYHIFIGTTFCVALSISSTVVFRYLVLKKSGVDRQIIFIMIVIGYIPPIVTIIIPFTDNWDFDIVRNQTYLEHPHYNLSIYEPFSGFCNIESTQFLSATGLLAIGSYGIPLMSAFMTRSILNMINSHSSMSSRTKSQAKTLVYGLTCQTLLPLVCYVPIFSLYTYSQLNGVENLASEHLLMILTCFPSFIDPFISFYFIVPYRYALLRAAGLKSQEATTMAVASSVSIKSVHHVKTSFR